MSKTKLFLGDIVRRFRHRYHRHFKSYRLGEAALNTPLSNVKVTLLSHGFQSEYELGYANGLARNGVQVTLIGSDTTLKNRLEPSIKLVNLRGSQDPARPKYKKLLGMLTYWVKCYTYVLLHRNITVHVIGMFNGNPWVAITEAWLTRVFSKHFILTIHDILPHDQHTKRNAKLNGVVFKAANQYIVHAKPMIRALHENYSIDLNKIHFIEHGMDEINLPTLNSRKAGRDFFGIKDDKPLILIFGNILYYKGTDLLIEAFNQLACNSDACLLIVGRCRKAALKQELQNMVNASEFKARIVWYDGFLPDENVVSTFHAADVLVMPYRHIYQSGVIFMSLATGLRTIVTDVGVLKNYIEKDFGRVVPVENVSALVLAIDEVLANKNPENHYFERIAKPYLWLNTVKPLISAYSNY